MNYGKKQKGVASKI